ncbi:MAG TPA: ABC transporter permease [Mycobacteriales bacterium]|nr:ABC transporter permease [Mycobacteriales bacterium]
MLGYVLAGLALGAIYAIASASLVVTFVSAGVLNFSFSAMAYTVARFYYYLNTEHHWGTDTAGVVAIGAFAPLLGVVLYLVLFQFLRGKSTLTKVVATIGLSVALPPVADLAMGKKEILAAPGLANLNDKPHKFFSAQVTNDQIITYVFLVVVVALGSYIFTRTEAGLKVRAVVDSEALASLSGSNPHRVAMGVWAASTMLAGLAGVLVAPANGLNTGGMLLLMAAAFAPVVAARLRSLPAAVIIAIAMGLVTDVIQKWIQGTDFAATLIPSIPFGFMLIALVYFTIKAGSLREESGARGALDAAIKPATEDADVAAAEAASLRGWSALLAGTPLIVVALLPVIFSGQSYWMNLVSLGICYSIIFLTYTLIAGEGGMMWLSQITFAGVGAMMTGQLVTHAHMNVLLAALCAAGIAAAIGSVIGLLTVKLGDLYIALTTLTFGILVDGLIFTRLRFAQGGLGVSVPRPGWATTDTKFFYLAFAVFVVIAALIINLRRSTSGLALRAARDSATASRTIGLSVLQMKVITGALGAFVAAIGGSFFAMHELVAQPLSYSPFLGLVWLAVIVTLGVRSITAAALAGMSFTLLPGVFDTYVPSKWADIPTIMFGLGAISVARNPEGVVAQQGHALRRLFGKLTPAKPAVAAAAQSGSMVAASAEPMPTTPSTIDVSDATPALVEQPATATDTLRTGGKHRKQVAS